MIQTLIPWGGYSSYPAFPETNLLLGWAASISRVVAILALSIERGVSGGILGWISVGDGRLLGVEISGLEERAQ